MIFDTDVLIWYLRGNERAFRAVENAGPFSISVVTYMELVQGMRNKNELIQLRKALRGWNSKILYINEDTSTKAMFYIERHFLSHSLQMADAFVAATAVVNGLPLRTGNTKHYRILKEVEVRVFRP